MERHFVQELENLRSNIIKMGSYAETAVKDSTAAFLHRDGALARQVIEHEHRINAMEVANDEAVVSLLALQQPVAGDLRLILAALKINNDLERIGDHAVNIAESAAHAAFDDAMQGKPELTRMAEFTQRMLRDALDGFIHDDASMCRSVLGLDDMIDELNKRLVDIMVGVIRANAAAVMQALDVVRVSRNLERIADLATNIAEEVIFVTEALVVKHRSEKQVFEKK
jgi:phosphate transport system protein